MTPSHLDERSSIAATDPARARRLVANLGPISANRTEHPPADSALVPPVNAPRPIRAGYRQNSIYERRGAITWRRLDRNQRAKLWVIAQGMERASKPKGARGGCLGHIGLTVFNALLFIYLNAESGRCDPSYKSLQKRTALCNGSISKAIDALEASGLLVVIRRMMRFRDERGVLVTRQISNAYLLPDPTAVSIPDHVPGATTGRPFPSRRDSPLTRALNGLADAMSGRVYRVAGNLKHPLAPRYATVPR